MVSPTGTSFGASIPPGSAGSTRQGQLCRGRFLYYPPTKGNAPHTAFYDTRRHRGRVVHPAFLPFSSALHDARCGCEDSHAALNSLQTIMKLGRVKLLPLSSCRGNPSHGLLAVRGAGGQAQCGGRCDAGQSTAPSSRAATSRPPAPRSRNSRRPPASPFLLRGTNARALDPDQVRVRRHRLLTWNGTHDALFFRQSWAFCGPTAACPTRSAPPPPRGLTPWNATGPTTPPPTIRRRAGRDGPAQMLGLNTRRGDVAAGETGLAALPGREAEARAAIDEALRLCRGRGAGAVHVMAGRAEGGPRRRLSSPNLRYACAQAGPGRIIPDRTAQPVGRAGLFPEPHRTGRRDHRRESERPNLRLMFDCYHVGRTEGDVIARLRALMPLIGHIQFAAVPDRGPPDQRHPRPRRRLRRDRGAWVGPPRWARNTRSRARPTTTLGWMTAAAGHLTAQAPGGPRSGAQRTTRDTRQCRFRFRS